ncbi:MAG: hypothetical protein LBK91_06700 [Synergistaceae bacterium]|nr:hypothetical protein [Synergistaceae bacterium]
MKRYFIGALVLSIFLSCGCAAHAGSPVIKNNARTSSHVILPGTHVAIVPPAGASVSGSFTGFEFPDGVSRIQISETAGVSYTETEGTLTPEGVESYGVSFTDKSPASLGGVKGTLVSGESVSDEEQSVLLLVLGDDRMSVSLLGSYPSGDRAAETAVRNSLLSVIFSPSSVKSTSGNYSLSSSGTSLKFYDEVGSTRYFTVGGKPTGNTLDDALYTSTVANESVLPDIRESYAASAMDKFMSGYEFSVKSSRSVRYGGLEGVETIVEFDGAMKTARTSSGASVRRQMKGTGYQVVLFDEDERRVFILSGIAVRDADAYASQFAKITSTFGIKR